MLPGLTPERVNRPELLNGDVPLSRAEKASYLEYHAARNIKNSLASGNVRTLNAPCACRGGSARLSPSRVAMKCFFEWAARTLAAGAGRDVTMLDIGCGDGIALEGFERAGFRGLYIGLDVSRSRKWRDGDTGAFRRRLIIEDAHEIDVSELPELDLIVSATALEHLRDDAAVIGRLSARLKPGGAQVHFVPGESSLALYGPHGYRQYSPTCLRALFPWGEIFRFGGAATHALHMFAITRPTERQRPVMGERYPRAYAMLRDAASIVDRLLLNRGPSMYGVLSRSRG